MQRVKIWVQKPGDVTPNRLQTMHRARAPFAQHPSPHTCAAQIQQSAECRPPRAVARLCKHTSRTTHCANSKPAMSAGLPEPCRGGYMRRGPLHPCLCSRQRRTYSQTYTQPCSYSLKAGATNACMPRHRMRGRRHALWHSAPDRPGSGRLRHARRPRNSASKPRLCRETHRTAAAAAPLAPTPTAPCTSRAGRTRAARRRTAAWYRWGPMRARSRR